MSGKIVAFRPSTSQRKRKRVSSEKEPPPLGMPAVLSFLRDTRGKLTWTATDMAKTLGVSLAQANGAIPLLSMQGYIKKTDALEWATTLAGEDISGSAAPHYKKEAIERALDGLRDRIRKLNKDPQAGFTVTGAVAYGDFLGDGARAQAADVGIQLKPRQMKDQTKNQGSSEGTGPIAHRVWKNLVLSGLRARSPMIRLHPYEDWMSGRTHRKLV